MEKKLEIKNEKYDIRIKGITTRDEGYKDYQVKADLSIEAKEISFYTISIIKFVSNKFLRVSNQEKCIIEKIIEILIQVILVHELVNIQQLKKK